MHTTMQAPCISQHMHGEAKFRHIRLVEITASVRVVRVSVKRDEEQMQIMMLRGVRVGAGKGVAVGVGLGWGQGHSLLLNR